MPISLWWVEISGTTAGYANDYDEVCPYSGSTSPDVVYTFTPSVATAVTVDMYGSAYDTKIYIYDESLSLIACNDDFYPDYTSRLDNVAVQAGVQYYLVIDGYGGYYGSYYGNVFVPQSHPIFPAPTVPSSRASRRSWTATWTRGTAAATALSSAIRSSR